MLGNSCIRVIIEIPDGGTDQNKVADFLTILGADMDARITKLQASMSALAIVAGAALAKIPTGSGDVLGADDVSALDNMTAEADTLTAQLTAAVGSPAPAAGDGSTGGTTAAPAAAPVAAAPHVGNAAVGAS